MTCRACSEENVKCVGIGAVRSEDMEYWSARGAVIKLVGYSVRTDNTVASCVMPVGNV